MRPGTVVAGEALVAAGDFLNCWGEDRGPCGEKAACVWGFEKGVEACGVGAAPPGY